MEKENKLCSIIHCEYDDGAESKDPLFSTLQRLGIENIRSLWLGLTTISYYIQFDKEKDDLSKLDEVIAVLNKYNCRYEIDDNEYFKTVYFAYPSTKTSPDALLKIADIAGKYDWYYKVISYSRFGLVKFEITERDFNKFVSEFKVVEEELKNNGYFIEVHTDYASDIESEWHHKFGVLQVFIVVAA